MVIIGRKQEQDSLERAFKNRESQFITIYGRRRVGKTYLIREFFSPKDCSFLHVTGLHNGKLHDQLANFIDAFSKTFYDGAHLIQPRSWREALHLLTDQIKKTDKKVVIFFDELPWMVTRKSGLLQMIDFFWNNQWAGMSNVIFIACGSSTSWLLKNIIYNTGGLHNRTTLEIKLKPFSLSETEDYLKSKNVALNQKHILSLYMAIGGIPYYLNYVRPGLTAQQNIQHLFFDDLAPLKKEFSKLFESLFNDAQAYSEIIEIIAQKKEGALRNEIARKAHHSSRGGSLTNRLSKLCDADFIKEFTPFGKISGSYYRVIDEFCLFYLHWVKSVPGYTFPPDYWLIQSQRPTYYAWSGYAFEAVCFKHIHQIIRALKINNASSIHSWRYVSATNRERGAQIDLVIDRTDDAITLCEIKYTDNAYAIDKNYAGQLDNKRRIFKKQTKTQKQLFWSMISANGLKKTLYSEEYISSYATLDDLFKAY